MTNPQDTPRPDPPPYEASPSTPAATEKQKRSFSIGQFLAGALFVLVVIFIVENTSKVEIRIIAGPKVSLPVWVALLAAAIVGALISMLLRWRRKHKNQTRNLPR